MQWPVVKRIISVFTHRIEDSYENGLRICGTLGQCSVRGPYDTEK
jgi:hypothetical protein